MEGTLVVNESRTKINNFKQWYQEKIVDTKISKGFDNAVTFVKTAESVVYSTGTNVASLVLVCIPEPTAATKLAAGLVKVAGSIIAAGKKLDSKIIIGTKHFIEGKLIGIDGTSKDIAIPSTSEYVDENELTPEDISTEPAVRSR